MSDLVVQIYSPSQGMEATREGGGKVPIFAGIGSEGERSVGQ
jgi:hypothetical protein